MPDEARYDELVEKRRSSGLSDGEANELGRLMAQKAGKSEEYSNAQTRRSGGADLEPAEAEQAEAEAAAHREAVEEAARQEARGEGEDET